MTADEVLELARACEAHAASEDSGEWFARLPPEAVEPAVEALLERGDVDAACDLVGSLSVYWQEIGAIEPGRGLVERALSAAGGSRSREAGRARLVLGELAFRQGDQETALAASAAARDIGDQVGDAWLAGRGELNLARVAFRDGDASRILDHARRVLARAGENDRMRAGGQHMRGWAEYVSGDVGAALTTFEQNAELYRAIGSPVQEASERGNVADLAMEQGDLDRAARNLAAALSVPAATASKYLSPSLVRSVGALSSLRGLHEDAVRLFAGAQELYRRFALEPDPGDELSPRLHAASIEALGPARARELAAEVAGWEDEQVVDAALRAAGAS